MLEPTQPGPDNPTERTVEPELGDGPERDGCSEDRRWPGTRVLRQGAASDPPEFLLGPEGASASPLEAPDVIEGVSEPPQTGSESVDVTPHTVVLPEEADAEILREPLPLDSTSSERTRDVHGTSDSGTRTGSAPEAEQDRGTVPDARTGSDPDTLPGDSLETETATDATLASGSASTGVPGVPRPTNVPVAPATRDARGSTLEAKGLVKTYRKRRVVNNVDLHVSQGEIVGLLGPNGAGKTTTFYMMVGLISPDAGRVLLDREDITRTPMYRRARRGVGYLSQEPSVFRKLTVEENVLAVLQMLGIPRREQKERLEELLDELGIKHLRESKGYALSGGERRRLEITRALVGRPKFMLLDEPFAGVDPIAVHDIQQIVADLRRRNIGVLISDHNVEQTLDIVDRAYIMYDGRVRISGTVSELVWNDEVAEIYLGPTLTARMRQRYTYPE